MFSSIISSSKPSKTSGRGLSRTTGGHKREKTGDTSNDYATVYLTIYIFRGEPDFHYSRHTLLYCTTPDNPDFYETVHVQRYDETSPWVVDRMHEETTWALTVNYINHVNAGTVLVPKGQEMVPVDIVAATPVENREKQSDWNCQHFILEGLQELVNRGYQTQEWYDFVQEELMDRLLEDSL